MNKVSRDPLPTDEQQCQGISNRKGEKDLSKENGLRHHRCEPFFVVSFWRRDSLARPRPVLFSGWGFGVERELGVGYSAFCSSGLKIKSSASEASLRGYLGLRATRVRSCPIPKRIRW